MTQQTKKVLKNEFCKKLNEEIRKSIEYQWKKEISILLLNLVHGVQCKSQYIYSNDTETTFIMYVVEKQYDYKSRKRYKECELKLCIYYVTLRFSAEKLANEVHS